MGGCHFFITLQFNHIYCVCGESNVQKMGRVKKMLTALFNFVWNTQKINFFECPGKIFLSIEKVLKKISEDQP